MSRIGVSVAFVLLACSESGDHSARSDGGAARSDGGDDCFAPDHDLELASAPEALAGGNRGCSCRPSSAACVEGLALICSDSPDPHWMSVEDGPCAPLRDPCTATFPNSDSCVAAGYDCYLAADGGICGHACGAVFPNVTDCLEDYTVCTQRADGFCGRQPRGD